MTPPAIATVPRGRLKLVAGDLAVAAVTVGVGAVLLAFNPDVPDPTRGDLAIAALGVLALVLRRCNTPVVLGLTVAGATVLGASLERPNPLSFASVVVLYTFCVSRPRQVALVVGVTVATVLWVGASAATGAALLDERSVIVVAWSAAAVGAADAVRSWRAFRAANEARVAEARAAGEAAARQRQADDRLRIAHELHDLLGHSLSVMNLHTGVAAHLLRSDPAKAEASLALARQAGRDVHSELRALLGVLRAGDADGAGPSDEPGPAAPHPTIDDIPRLVGSLEGSGRAVRWRATGRPRPLSPPVSLAAYRITQEALTNAVRHGTGPIDLTTAYDPPNLVITVENHVTARHDPRTGDGLGVIGMQERAAAADGRVDLEALGDRFTLRAVLPIASEGA